MTPGEQTRKIIAEIAELNRTTLEAVLSPCRERHVVRARYQAMRAIKMAKPSLSAPQIGRIFNRDHSTVTRIFGGVRYRNPSRQEDAERWVRELGGPLPDSIRLVLGRNRRGDRP